MAIAWLPEPGFGGSDPLQEFDYIVAGGGSAGCVLAARLAEDPSLKIALIEAGGQGRNLFIRMPAGNGFIFGNPKLDWGFESIPQKSLNGRRIYYPRGKALGGSSIMNGMIYMRGVSADYDGWRDEGLTGWGYSDLLPYFKKSQGSVNRNNPWHGATGPMKTDQSVNFGVLEQAFVDAAIAAGHDLLDDFNAADRTGVGRTDSNIHRGVRQSSAIAYLKHIPANLTLLTKCHIAKLKCQGHQVVGVESLDGDSIYASREVILCQGAFGTPQTLMLSGIGPADHLTARSIRPVVDLKGVGQSLSDHMDVSIQYGSDRMDLSLARFQRLDKAVGLMTRWLLNQSGPGAGAFFSAVLFHALKDPALPEFEVFMTPMVIDENMTGGAEEKTPLLQQLGRKLLVRGRKVAKPGVQIDINLERPRSEGSVQLASNNPLEPPLIDPNFLAAEQDMTEMLQAVKDIRELMSQAPISRYVTGELGAWKNARRDEEIIEAIRNTAYTGHHPCSSARMGSDGDDMAVLDAQLRVRGIDNLRVCDASAMPSNITGNPNATIIAMAEKAADLVLGRAALPPENPAS